jgi:HSP20 family protein
MRYSIFDDLFGPTRFDGFGPKMDLLEEDSAYVIKMDAPGVRKDDLSIELRDNILTIRGHREESYGSAQGLEHIERLSGSFERSVRLPNGVEDIDADLDHGVLTLHIAKPEEAKPRRIEIGDSSRRLIEA